MRRFRGEWQNPNFFAERQTARTPGVIVWGAICPESRSPLVFIEGNLTAASYIANVLEPICVPYLQGLNDSLFQQDNARPYTVTASAAFLKGAHIDILPWPARSPDLSPIEHVWDMLGKILQQLPHPSNNLDDLRQASRSLGQSPTRPIDNLLRSMPRRVNECIQNAGGPTHY
ncbi:DDE 3 domain containing protein [Asbolus verrucosus]|uniref:DDE 3 domain containing protein n=1 Tax=Asbolus verrucosus TaxID=1661398 RepID=A0A482W891_ASBVE|nr:DDE 3 domain containing protein [Asbolus verrucosus]